MIRSMTGFGSSAGTVADRFAITVSVKSVNHRYLEVSVRLPEFLWEIEPRIRALAAELFNRGKIDLSLRAQRLVEPEYTARVNRKIAEALIPQLKELMSQFRVNEPLTPTDLLRLPDLVEVTTLNSDLLDEERDQITAIVRQAFEKVQAMRVEEGLALRSDIEARLNTIKLHRQSIESQRSDIIEELLENYRQRVQELAQTAGIIIDQDRLAQETVLMV